MKKIVKQIVLMAALVSLMACQQSGQDAAQVVQLTKSHSAKSAGISLQFSALNALHLGVEYAVELIWTASPEAMIELTPINRDEYLWVSSPQHLTTNEKGVANTSLNFVPQQVGRAYLKVMAVTTGEQGQVSKVFNIPYTVHGASDAKPGAKKLMLPVEPL